MSALRTLRRAAPLIVLAGAGTAAMVLRRRLAPRPALPPGRPRPAPLTVPEGGRIDIVRVVDDLLETRR
jgi:hypothetical protein